MLCLTVHIYTLIVCIPSNLAFCIAFEFCNSGISACSQRADLVTAFGVKLLYFHIFYCVYELALLYCVEPSYFE